jgi:hypothetical protein
MVIDTAMHAVWQHDMQTASMRHQARFSPDGELYAVERHAKDVLAVSSALEAGERYAPLLTLSVNCAPCGANPFLYVTELFDRLAAGWPNARAAELMPQAWLAPQQQTEKVRAKPGSVRSTTDVLAPSAASRQVGPGALHSSRQRWNVEALDWHRFASHELEDIERLRRMKPSTTIRAKA